VGEGVSLSRTFKHCFNETPKSMPETGRAPQNYSRGAGSSWWLCENNRNFFVRAKVNESSLCKGAEEES